MLNSDHFHDTLESMNFTVKPSVHPLEEIRVELCTYEAQFECFRTEGEVWIVIGRTIYLCGSNYFIQYSFFKLKLDVPIVIVKVKLDGEITD